MSRPADCGLRVAPDATARIGALAEHVRRALVAALAQRGSAVLAVSGGRSPVALFAALREVPLDWSRVTVTLVDERLVAPTHPDSNEALVREHLLRGAASAARMLGLVDPERVELEHCVRLANRRAGQPDVVLLGMGDDGHTASLFAGAQGFEQAMDERGAARYVGVVPGQAPYARISLSLRALLAAPCLLMSLEGQTKRGVFDAACADPASTLPVARLIHHPDARLQTWWSP